MANGLRLWWLVGLSGLCSLSYLALPGCSSSGDDDDDGDDDITEGDDDATSPSSGDDDDATSPTGSATSIYDLNENPPPDDTVVTTTGVITAITYQNNFWISDPDGGEYSGLYVYTEFQFPEDSTPPFAVGDEVEVNGAFVTYFDLRELKVTASAGSIEVLQSGATPPDPIEVGLGDLVGAACTEGLNPALDGFVSALLALPEATVIATSEDGVCDYDPPAFGYWEIEDDDQNTLMVDDDVDYSYTPKNGDRVKLTGVLFYSFEQYKLEPAGDAGIEEISASERSMVK